MIECDVCKRQFRYNYLLMKHLERKIPCKPIQEKTQPSELVREQRFNRKSKNLTNGIKNLTNDSKNLTNGIIHLTNGINNLTNGIISESESIRDRLDTEELKCEYCHKMLSSRQRLETHKRNCHLKCDAVRLLEIQMNMDVTIYCDSLKCRFCDVVFYNKNNLHRHDKKCKYKDIYMKELSKKQSMKDIAPNNITINNYTTNNTLNQNNTMNQNNNTLNIRNYDHDYAHVTIDQIVKCLQISKEKREDAIASLSRFIRDNDKNDRSIIVSNLRGKTVKAFEDGQYVTKDARHAISHRGQEAAFRLDSAKEEVDAEHQPLWKNKDFGDIESTLSMVTHSTTDKDANKVYEAVKMAVYDANKSLCISNEPET